MDETFDFVVVGSGGGSLCAALVRARVERQAVSRAPVRARAHWRASRGESMISPQTSSPVTTRVPHGRACHSCSPASISIRANAANVVGLRPSAFLEDPNIQAEGPNGVRHDHRRARYPREVCSYGGDRRSRRRSAQRNAHTSASPCGNVATEGEARRVPPGTRTRFGSASSTRTSASRRTPELSSSQPGGSAQCQPPGARAHFSLMRKDNSYGYRRSSRPWTRT